MSDPEACEHSGHSTAHNNKSLTNLLLVLESLVLLLFLLLLLPLALRLRFLLCPRVLPFAFVLRLAVEDAVLVLVVVGVPSAPETGVNGVDVLLEVLGVEVVAVLLLLLLLLLVCVGLLVAFARRDTVNERR